MVVFCPSVAFGFAPSDLSNLSLWLKADSLGSDTERLFHRGPIAVEMQITQLRVQLVLSQSLRTIY